MTIPKYHSQQLRYRKSSALVSMITSLPTTNLLMQLLPRTIAALATAATLLFLATIVLPAAYGDSTHISADTNVDVDQKNNCKSTAKDISVSANECNNDAIFSVT